jgi:hypothetical protein
MGYSYFSLNLRGSIMRVLKQIVMMCFSFALFGMVFAGQNNKTAPAKQSKEHLVSIVINGDKGQVTHKGKQFYLEVSGLSPTSTIYRDYYDYPKAQISTHFFLSKAWADRSKWHLGENKTVVHMHGDRKGQAFEIMRQFVLSSPKCTNKHSCRFTLSGFKKNHPPKLGHFQLVHLFFTQCQVKKVDHLERVLC